MFTLSIGTWCITIQRAAPDVQDIAHMYDAASKRWNSVLELLGCSRSYATLFEQLKNDGWLSRMHERAKIIDCGIGTAALTTALIKKTHCKLEIHGVDVAPRMLTQARNNLKQFEPTGLTMQFNCGNVDSLPYPAGEFDVVMSAHMLEHSPTPSETIREMVRVLKNNAPLLIVTTCRNKISSLHSLRWRYRPIESHQLIRWMNEAGLRDVQKYMLTNSSLVPGPMSVAYIGRK
ncbi:MAG: methyltransferase domain-containing protein [Gallionellaceae bacterium]